VYIISIFRQVSPILCKAHAPVLLFWLRMFQTDDSDILCTYMRIQCKSTVARNRRVTVNLSSAGITSLKVVYFFSICGHTGLNKSSESYGDIRK
jgi:hypothetical protein